MYRGCEDSFLINHVSKLSKFNHISRKKCSTCFSFMLFIPFGLKMYGLKSELRRLGWNSWFIVMNVIYKEKDKTILVVFYFSFFVFFLLLTRRKRLELELQYKVALLQTTLDVRFFSPEDTNVCHATRFFFICLISCNLFESDFLSGSYQFNQ